MYDKLLIESQKGATWTRDLSPEMNQHNCSIRSTHTRPVVITICTLLALRPFIRPNFSISRETKQIFSAYLGWPRWTLTTFVALMSLNVIYSISIGYKPVVSSLLIHSADPQSQPVVIIIFTHVVRTCLRAYAKSSKTKNQIYQVRRMCITGESVGIAERIIDDTCLVMLASPATSNLIKTPQNFFANAEATTARSVSYIFPPRKHFMRCCRSVAV